MTKYWMVGLGGFLGSIARFWLGSFITYRMGARFPYGTFVINITGSFVIGLIVTLLAERPHWNANLLYLIPIGFIGAYTTFSTFEMEAFRSVRMRRLSVVAAVCPAQRLGRISRRVARSDPGTRAGIIRTGLTLLNCHHTPRLDSFCASYQNDLWIAALERLRLGGCSLGPSRGNSRAPGENRRRARKSAHTRAEVFAGVSSNRRPDLPPGHWDGRSAIAKREARDAFR